MAEAVYLLCAVTCLVCMLLLLRGYQQKRTRLLLWSGLCFAGLTANNALLFVDKVMLPDTSLTLARSLTALLGLLLLLYGLVWEAE